MVHVPAPPVVVALRVTCPPIHTLDDVGLMETVGSGATVTAAVLETPGSQLLPVQE